MDNTARGQLVDLPADECWQLLTTTPVGRIAWTTSTGPEVIPVNFAVDGRTIKIRTTAYSSMVQKADAEVRYGDPEEQTGPEPWVRGPRSATVVIDVDEITGRWLNPPEH